MFDKLINTVTGFLPNLVWLILAVVVGVTIHSVRMGGFMLQDYLQGIAVVVTAGVTTALWLGAIHNAD